MTVPFRLPGPLIATGLFLAAFALYLVTTSSSVLLEDDGLFILAAWFNGVAHPPGYPLWTLLAHPFSQIPIGSVAFRVHAFSAIAAALCIPLVWSITLKLTGRQLPALTAALALALSQTFWSQAIVAEVYALNLILLLALIRLLLIAYRPDATIPETGDNAREKAFPRLRPERPRGWKGHLVVGLLAGVYGLSLTNHWPLIGLSSFGLLALALPWFRSVLTRLPIAIPALLIGLLPYLWMVIHSQQGPLISFMGPMDYWHEFRSVVLREQYAGVDQSDTATHVDQLRYLAFIFKQWTVEFGFPGALLGIVGLAAYSRSGNRWITLGLLLITLGNSLVLVALLGFDFDDLYVSVFRVYPMIAWAMLAIALGLGLSVFATWAERKGLPRASLLTSGAALLTLLSALAGSLPMNDRSEDSWAQDYARAVLEDVPENAWVIVEQDTDTGPISYLHLVEGVRPDITLFNAFGLLLPTRLGHPLREGKQGIESAWSAIMGAYPPVPIVSVGNYDPGSEKVIRTWLYTQLAPSPDAPRLSLRMSETQYAYWDHIKHLPPLTDPWSKIHRQALMANLAQLLAAKRYRDDPEQGFRPVEQDMSELGRGLFARLQILRIQLASGRYDADNILQDFTAIQQLITSTTLKSYHAQVYELLGTYHLREGRPNEALGGWVRSLEISPRPGNPATTLVRRLAARSGKPQLLEEMRRRFPTAFPD